MQGNLHIRAYEPGDEERINDAFCEVFATHRSLAEWRWKFAERPEGRWIIVAVDAGGNVVGHYAAVPARTKVDGLTVVAGQIVDVLTRPSVRIGLAAARTYLQTVNAFFDTMTGPDKLSFLYGFPSEAALRLGVAKLGYDAMPPQEVPVLRRDLGRRSRYFTGHRLLRGFNAEKIDTLWLRSAVRYRVAILRDAEFYKWRYTTRPDVEYLYLCAVRRGEPRAAAVVRWQSPVLHVVDLVWDGSDEGAIAELDRGIVAMARGVSAERVEMWLSGDPEASSVLVHLGWSRVGVPNLIVVARSFDPRVDVAAFPGIHYLTMGDSDLF